MNVARIMGFVYVYVVSSYLLKQTNYTTYTVH